MRSRIIFVLLALIVPSALLGQTYVSGFPPELDSSSANLEEFFNEGERISGPVFGIWTAENSPYMIGGDIYVPAGFSLDIQQGVTVEFLDDYDFSVYGFLLVTGEMNDSTYILGNGVLHIENPSGGSHFQYAYIDFADIYLNHGATSFNNCRLYNHIRAPSSSGNSITDCYIWGTINQGTDWIVIGNEINFHSGAFITMFAVSNTVYQASGTFIDNDISSSATATGSIWMGEAYARGFYECSGVIAHNKVSASAYGETYDESYGISTCTGNVHHNLVTAGTCGITSCTGEIYNNTVYNSGTGIYNASGDVANCIVYDCNTGFSGGFEVSYSCVFDCNTPYSGVTMGAGNIEEDPMFTGNYELQITSPCIDTGDPDSMYIDPDETRDDMGANFFDQSVLGVPPLLIHLEEDNVVLNWEPVALADGYNIYRSQDPYIFNQIPMVTITDTTYTDSSAVLDDDYFYRLTVER